MGWPAFGKLDLLGDQGLEDTCLFRTSAVRDCQLPKMRASFWQRVQPSNLTQPSGA